MIASSLAQIFFPSWLRFGPGPGPAGQAGWPSQRQGKKCQRARFYSLFGFAKPSLKAMTVERLGWREAQALSGWTPAGEYLALLVWQGPKASRGFAA